MEDLEAASGNQAFGLNEMDVMSLPQILDETPGKRYPARQATPAAALVVYLEAAPGSPIDTEQLGRKRGVRPPRNTGQHRPRRGKTELT
jgi:hypothetical protein